MINSLRVSGLTEVIMLELSGDVSGCILGMGVEGCRASSSKTGNVVRNM